MSARPKYLSDVKQNAKTIVRKAKHDLALLLSDAPDAIVVHIMHQVWPDNDRAALDVRSEVEAMQQEGDRNGYDDE